MNSALLLSNAIALMILVGFNIAPESDAEPLAQRMPHYLQVQKAPQLAAMNDRGSFAGQELGQEVSHDGTFDTAQYPERLVF